eukprot:3694380-Prymnesium_polylepis.1
MASPCGRPAAIVASRSTASVRNAVFRYLPFCTLQRFRHSSLQMPFRLYCSARSSGYNTTSPSCPTPWTDAALR